MEDKTLNEKESLALIAQMIEQTKQRLTMGSGNICLVWGYITVTVTALVWVLLLLTGNHVFNWLFFLIWIIGGGITARISKCEKTKSVKTYVDRISNGLWQIVGYCAIILTFISLCIMLFAGKDSWAVMLVFALLIVGFGASIQGIIIKERSMIAGGSVGIAFGAVTMCLITAGINIFDGHWYYPMFIISFICMMIIPGHIINNKASRLCSRS